MGRGRSAEESRKLRTFPGHVRPVNRPAPYFFPDFALTFVPRSRSPFLA